MEQLGVVILPLALSAVTWAAYNHPREYDRFVYTPLAVICMLVLFIVFAIQITSDVTTSAVLQATPQNISFAQRDEMRNAGGSTRPSGW